MSNISITIGQLAKSVFYSDSHNGRGSSPQVAHELEIALKTKVGLLCDGGSTVDIDLGNGYLLHCSVGRRDVSGGFEATQFAPKAVPKRPTGVSGGLGAAQAFKASGAALLTTTMLVCGG
jgi:hypothetical protein